MLTRSHPSIRVGKEVSFLTLPEEISQDMLSLPSSLSAPLWPPKLRQFSLSEIVKATNNFDPLMILRRGWSFEVFKGTYDDYDGTKKTVAIKSFHFEQESLQVALPWFERELYAWSQYRHKHVVLVIGYCQEPPDTCIIVYEYMPNGSLAQHLPTKETHTSFYFPWDKCLHICIDVARGLEYMHTHISYSDGNPFIHSDVTITNILLDGNGVAKISDLYNEPAFTRQKESAYNFDPEYHISGLIDQSSDVYAFGVLLVKILSRKVSFNKENMYFGTVFKQLIVSGNIHQIIHPEMRLHMSRDCLEVFVYSAGECLDNESHKRPSFTQVLKKLELSMASSSSSQRLCHRYSFCEIEEATNNFENIIGEGGEGKVYKGVTKSNITVAVKRLKPERSFELEKEIKMLLDLDHRNLVSLVGYCHESDHNILVYEFMCNGNLDKKLYGRAACSLSWKQRLNICIGAGRGLKYLHTPTNSSPKGIIHRDVKPVNILLDENFNAKISDFGLSKMGPQDQSSSEISTGLKGTIGYYAPEYNRYGRITRGVDVYAFGVVLCELLCRKKPWDREESFYPTENEKYGQWAKENIDPDLEGEIAPVCLEAFTFIMEKCLNLNPNRRPSMDDVVPMLEFALECQDVCEIHMSGGAFCAPDIKPRYVENSLGNQEQLVNLINDLHIERVAEGSVGRRDWHKQRSNWFKRKQALVREFFSKPGTSISFSIAMMLVLLILIQTICSVVGIISYGY